MLIFPNVNVLNKCLEKYVVKSTKKALYSLLTALRAPRPTDNWCFRYILWPKHSKLNLRNDKIEQCCPMHKLSNLKKKLNTTWQFLQTLYILHLSGQLIFYHQFLQTLYILHLSGQLIFYHQFLQTLYIFQKYIKLYIFFKNLQTLYFLHLSGQLIFSKQKLAKLSQTFFTIILADHYFYNYFGNLNSAGIWNYFLILY